MILEPECRDDLPRRRRIRASGVGNGIDWVEVEPDGLTLTLAFVRRAPELTVGNVRIEPGPSGVDVRAVALDVCRDEDREHDECVTVTLDRPGVGPGYRLCLVDPGPSGGPGTRPMTGLDPRLACVEIAFGVECPQDLDCLVGETCPPESFPEPELSYLARDYASFRQLLLDRMAHVMPDWTERHVPDVGMAMVELLAYVGDHLSYEQDAIATEAYLDTARLRTSVRRHVRLIDYRMHDGVNARAWVAITVSTPVPIEAGAAWWFVTTPDGAVDPQGAALTDDDLRNLPEGSYETFEPVDHGRVSLWPAHNEISFWTWGQRECCLGAGATRATLRDAWVVPQASPDAKVTQARSRSSRARAAASRAAERERLLRLAPGDVVILEELRSPTTGIPADADRSHRQAVRLTRVTPSVDETCGVPVVEVEWSPEDALTFSLCLTAVAGPQCEEIEISVARGNVVLVDHGRSTTRCGQPPELLCAPCPPPGPADCVEVPCEDRYEPGAPVPGRVSFSPRLAQSPVTVAEPFPRRDRIVAEQARLLGSLADRVDRRLREIWGDVRVRGTVTDVELAELRTILGRAAVEEAGLGGGAVDARSAVAWLMGRKERLLESKLRRIASLARRARSGYVLGRGEAEEVARAWGEPYAEGLSGDTPAAWGSAAAALAQDPRRALPAIELLEVGAGGAGMAWEARADLLASDPGDRHVVVEVDDDGRSRLRFGDGVLGRAVEPGLRLEARYRVGNGVTGNVAAGAISRVVFCSQARPGIIGVRNPLPAQGGTDPEPVAEVRLTAPAVVRRAERAVTEADYAAVAGRVRGTQRAAAAMRWTGSWYEAQVAVDAAGTEEAPAELLARTEDALHRVRRIGHDLRVGTARRVPIDLALRVCVLPGFERGAVARAIIERLGTRRLPDGTTGFFNPDRLSFGEDVYVSAIVGLVQAIAGVESVTLTTLERQDEGPAEELELGVLDVRPLEVAELDRGAPIPRGRLRLDMRGGR